MENLTGIELQSRRTALEDSSALELGRITAEFARLDMAIGLAVVWAGDGHNVKDRTKAFDGVIMNTKLEELAKAVAAKHPTGSKRRAAYESWLLRAHTMRKLRNDLVHGRWGVDPMRGVAVNVIGLPTSPEQRATDYTLDQLAGIVTELKALQVELSRLRDHWPV